MDAAAAEAVIRARRTLTNSWIATHQATRLRTAFAKDATVTVGGGGVLMGVDAIVAAFETQFREPGFIAYERSPQTLEVSADGARAAEAARWVGRWLGRASMSGTYLTGWRSDGGLWLIEQELYVTLAG